MFNVTTALSFSARGVRAADVDGDGRVDVFGNSYQSPGTLVFYKNLGGNPVVFDATTLFTQNAGNFIDVADLDGDGRLDVLASYINGGRAVWVRNEGGTPATWTSNDVSSTTVSGGVYSVRAADVDGDGRMDVVAANSTHPLSSLFNLVWFQNMGGSPVPSWTRYVISASGRGAICVETADMDNDGRVDVLAANYHDNSLVMHVNVGGSPPVWTTRTLIAFMNQPTWVTAADVNNDGCDPYWLWFVGV
jgi:hypothetical protein